MSNRFLTGVAIVVPVLVTTIAAGQGPHQIPKTWDDAAIASLEVPLAKAEYSPVHVDARFYDAIPVGPI